MKKKKKMDHKGLGLGEKEKGHEEIKTAYFSIFVNNRK